MNPRTARSAGFLLDIGQKTTLWTQESAHTSGLIGMRGIDYRLISHG
jgi:hypothetical protein